MSAWRIGTGKTKVWRPERTFRTDGNSAAWENNMDVAQEASKAARWEAADFVVQMEISRQLDRIANALEKDREA